jgi:hypothetical protein
MEVFRSNDRKGFPIKIKFNSGYQYLTIEAAKELAGKLTRQAEMEEAYTRIRAESNNGFNSTPPVDGAS